jgi:hypothetical protein
VYGVESGVGKELKAAVAGWKQRSWSVDDAAAAGQGIGELSGIVDERRNGSFRHDSCNAFSSSKTPSWDRTMWTLDANRSRDATDLGPAQCAISENGCWHGRVAHAGFSQQRRCVAVLLEESLTCHCCAWRLFFFHQKRAAVAIAQRTYAESPHWSWTG